VPVRLAIGAGMRNAPSGSRARCGPEIEIAWKGLEARLAPSPVELIYRMGPDGQSPIHSPRLKELVAENMEDGEPSLGHLPEVEAKDIERDSLDRTRCVTR